MKPAPFSYHRPATLAEALEAYAAEPDAKILAGGQSLIPLLSMRLAAPSMLIDINGIAELDRLRVEADGVGFGATVRHTRLLHDVDARRIQPLLHKALGYVAHPTIRNRGTTLGSIVHADAAAEMPAVLAVLDGSVTAASASGTRTIPAAELFVGPLETSLAPGEIATEAHIPALAAGSGVAFDELARRHGDYALCGVAAMVSADEFGAITAVRTGYLSVCEIPTVVDVSEVFMDGTFTDAAAADAAELAVASLEPESDIHASAGYRRHLARVLTARVVREAHDDCVARRTGVPR
ncbi:MAG: FAD binding domain-containing protein [Nocardioidaceae bacterium]